MKGNLVFSIMFEKFRFDGDFFARNLDASVELRQHQWLHKGFFSFLDRMVLFLSSLNLFFFLFFFCFWFFLVNFLPLLIFP